MQRTLNIDTVKNLNQLVKVCGWVNTRRDHGGIVFFDLRDRSGLLQVVSEPALAQGVKEEDVVEVEGKVQERPPQMVNTNLATGKIELRAETVKVLAESVPLPFDYLSKETELKLPTALDYRPLMIRDPKIKTIFKIAAEITDSFKNTLKGLGFTEFQSPVIVPAVAEGGAEVFRIDYYKYDAFLAQSPQLYKQIMLGAFERVFTIAHVFRAEPSITTRHLSEYVSLDAEIAFIESWEEVMDICETIVRNVFNDLQKNCSKELVVHHAAMPNLTQKIPRLKMREAQKIIFERTGQDRREEPDLTPEDEKEICQFTKEKYGSELIFITHYPVAKRPFYTLADPKDPKYTLSFDLLYQGLEIMTGGQRINNYDQLVKNIKKWGNETKDFAFYLQAFKYGLPQEGGFAFGLERMVKQILGLKNIREATPFPRDMERVDQRLSLLQKTKKKKKKSKKPKR